MLKKLYSLIMIIMLVSSCATKKHITSSTTTSATNIVTDSATQSKNISEDLQIEWFFDGEETSGISDTTNIPKWLKPILPSTDKPPKKGKLRITISKHFSSTTQQTKVEKSVKSKQKEKAKTTEKAKESVKSPNRNWLISSIIIIIFGFIVKYVLEHKNNLKKAWRKVKKSLSLHQP
jgi:hypothetical protein